MKINENLLRKGVRAIIQRTLKRETSEPCGVCWTYQPHRPDRPLPSPHYDREKFR